MLNVLSNLLSSLNLTPEAITSLLSPQGAQSPAEGMTTTPQPQGELTDILAQSAAAVNSKGMDDSVPAAIDGATPAALSQGEFVIPADIVSLLGDGHSESGAKVLENFMNSIRQMKTGKTEQPADILSLLTKTK